MATIGQIYNGYLIVNGGGTQMKLPKLKWRYQILFAIKQAVKGYVSLEEIKKAAYRGNK